MNKYPKARWSVGEATVGASVWTRKLEDRAGEGGGYYRYTWERSSLVVAVEELTSAAGPERRQFPYGEKSAYTTIDTITVPEDIREQNETGRELYIGQLIFADIRHRFEPVAEWINYGNDGKKIWFHDLVTG